MQQNSRISPVLASFSSGQLYNAWHCLPALQHALWCWPLVMGLTLLSCLSILPATLALQDGHWGSLAYLLLFIPILAFHACLFLIMRGHRMTISLGCGMASFIWSSVAWVNGVSAIHLWLAEYVTLCNLIAFAIMFGHCRSGDPNKPATLIRFYGLCFMFAGCATIVLQLLKMSGVTFGVEMFASNSDSLLIKGMFPSQILFQTALFDINILCLSAIFAYALFYTGYLICRSGQQAVPLMPRDTDWAH